MQQPAERQGLDRGHFRAGALLDPALTGPDRVAVDEHRARAARSLAAARLRPRQGDLVAQRRQQRPGAPHGALDPVHLQRHVRRAAAERRFGVDVGSIGRGHGPMVDLNVDQRQRVGTRNRGAGLADRGDRAEPRVHPGRRQPARITGLPGGIGSGEVTSRATCRGARASYRWEAFQLLAAG